MSDFPDQLLQALSSLKALQDCNNAVETDPHLSNPGGVGEESLSEVASELESLLSQHNNPDNVMEYLRATKNLLKWNLQNMPPNNDQLACLQSKENLDVYMQFLEASIGKEEEQETARFATLCLFYATYSTQRDGLFDHLVDKLSYLRVLCSVLSNGKTTTSVQLANLRLLHSLLVSLPGFCKVVSKHGITVVEEDMRFSATNVQDLLLFLLVWCMEEFQDRKLEVATEILRILYVLRAGRTMSEELLKQLLLLPDCRLATITLLMDAPAAIIVEMDVQSLLLETLETQVAAVVDQTLLGSEAASAMTPILVVTHNLCRSDQDYKGATKDFIFPNPLDSNASSKAMSPSDAPKGSLRFKCIQLLGGGTDSHTKRLTAELLWTLCDEVADEYTKRVGLGNAILLLNAKGLMELPT
jgi:hypothetical protein